MNTILCKSFFIACFCLAIFTPLQASDDIEIISSDASHFHFNVISKPDLSGLQKQTHKDSSVTYSRNILVGIPENARVIVSIVRGQAAKTVTSDSYSFNGSMGYRPMVSVSEPMTVRNRQLVNVKVSPIVGNSVYTKIEIQLDFRITDAGKNGAVVDDPVFNRIFKASVANYEDFVSWPVPSKVRQALALQDENHPFSKTSNWYKIRVNQTGLYRLTGAQLQAAGINLANLESDNIRIFNGGGLPVSLFNENPRPEFLEISLLVRDGGDGLFGANDTLYFYGEAVNRWIYNEGQSISYINNKYTTDNIYWLTTSTNITDPVQRMVSYDGTPGTADSTINSFRRRVHVEQDSMLAPDDDGHMRDYYRWFWSSNTTVSFTVATPAAIENDSAYIYLRGRTNGSASINGYMNLYVNSTFGSNKNCNKFECIYSTRALLDGINSIVINLTQISSLLPSYFDYFEINYNSHLEPSSGQLDFPLGSYDGRYRIDLTNDFSSTPLILNISNPRRPERIVNFSQGSLLSFEADLMPTSYNRFYAVEFNRAKSPLSITPATINNLRAGYSQADVLIVTDPAFVNALGEYIDYRESQGYSMKVITVADIMDNFSYGLYDPVAIRDYLKYAYDNYPAPAPATVLFVGDANFDILNRLGTNVPNRVPTLLHPYANYDETYNDDNYVYFGDYGILDSDTSFIYESDRGYDMVTARWPVTSTAQIQTVTSKIKSYESPANLGFWRDDITLVSDDEFTGEYSYESFHTKQTEALSKDHIPAGFRQDKIYLWDYPFVGRDKPEVNDAIVDAFNNGTLLVNYVGHGNPDVWAHEHVFQRTTDLPRLHNSTRLPLVFAASCNISMFDDPTREGMGEDLLSLPGGGAIGVIAATRLVYSSDNSAFNKAVFDVLLKNKDLSMAEAMFAAKMLRQYDLADTTIALLENDRTYIYFGDPLLKLGMPRLDIGFSQKPDSLQALSTVNVSGRILADGGQTYDHSGEIMINVFDSERNKTHRLTSPTGQIVEEVSYQVTGPTIFRGTATVTNGEFNFDFIVPLDISYGGENARIYVYAILDTLDAVGVVDSIPLADSIAVNADSVGPTIAYTFSGRQNFLSGDMIALGENLELTISDPSGINLAGGLGHGITLEIDDNPEKMYNLSQHFEYALDNYTSGQLSFVIDSLGQGEHRFKIKAWDNANNSTSVEFTALLAARGVMAISNLLNYPNPMHDRTTFYFGISQAAEAFTLDIFTLAGRKIMTFNRYGLPADNYEIDWFGQDTEGDRVATGVYIYKATVQPQAGGERVESFGKVVVIN